MFSVRYKFNFHAETHQLPNDKSEAVEFNAGIQFTKILSDYSNSQNLTRLYS